MTVRTFYATDAGAPTLSSTSGQAVTFFDAILVDGYNSQTLTSITRSGATATATKAGHGFRTGQLVNHADANEVEYNGNFRITVTGADTYDFTVSGTPASPATGTITAKVASLGWTKEFSAAGKAVYRPPSGNRFYLRIDHSGTTSVYARGYEAMTDVDTGERPFPTVAQMANGSGFYQANTNAHDWMAMGDEKRVYVVMEHTALVGAATGAGANLFVFGDFTSYKSGDAYNTAIIGASTYNATSSDGLNYASIKYASQVGKHCARSYTQAGGSIAIVKATASPYWSFGSAEGYSGNPTDTQPYPNSANGTLDLYPTYVGETANDVLRGLFPGMWFTSHAYTNFNHKDTFSGSGDLAGKDFVILRAGYQGGGVGGCIVLEVSDTWS